MARPTKYNQEIVTKAQHYLENYGEYGHKIPSRAGLALVPGLSRETLRTWPKDEDKKEFSAILDRINQKQECVLLDNGLDGTFNSAITKLVLGKHGYHDRSQQADTQVQVIINRGGVVLKSGNETLAIEENQAVIVLFLASIVRMSAFLQPGHLVGANTNNHLTTGIRP